MSLPLWALWLQAMPDVRTMAWWLPSSGAARTLFWWAVFTVNLAILVYILYRLLFAGKGWSIPGALRGRGSGIQVQLLDADSAQRNAQARLAEVESRIASLPREMAALKAEAEAEAEREYQRLVESSRREAENIRQAGKREMELTAKLARQELHGLAAALALDLAAQRLRERMNDEMDRSVVRQALAGIRLQTGSGRPN